MKTSCACRLSFLLLGLFALAPAWGRSDVRAVVSAARGYESGASTEPLRQIERWVAAATSDGGLRRELNAELARLLTSDATYEAKRFACQQLAVIGTEAAVPGLATLLAQPETVDIACQALANIPSAKAGAALRAAVPKLQGLAKIEVVKTLGTRREADAVPLLTGLIQDPDPGVAEAAIIGLGKVANPAALKTLAGLRANPDPARTAAVAEASLLAAERLAAGALPRNVNKLYEELLDPGYPPSVRRGALEGLFEQDADHGQQRVLEILKTKDVALKPVAIARIPALPDPSVSARFARELANLEPADQALLVEALALRGDPAALPAVQALLESPDPALRGAVIAALGDLGDASTVFPLSRALMTAQGVEETRAIEAALVRLKGGDSVDRALMARLRDRMAGPKAPLLTALVRRGNRVAWPGLMAEARSPEPAQARLAFQGLSRLATAEDLPELLRALIEMRAPARPEAEAAVAQALERVTPASRRSTAVCAALAGPTTPEAHASLLRLLPVCGDLESLAVLEGAIEDPAFQDVAVRALADWPDDMAWDSLMLQFARSGNEAQRAVILRGLTRLASERNARPTTALIERYGRLLAQAKGDSDRKMILGTLAGCASPEALKLAVDQLSKPGVRAEAVLAIKTIAEAIKAQYPQAAQEALGRIQ